MICRFYDNRNWCGDSDITNGALNDPGQTSTKCQGTGVHCTQEFVKPLYRSRIPKTLSRKQLDGTPYGLFLEALERGDKEGLFDCIANLEGTLERTLLILKGRSASNARWLSTLQHFAESYGLHLPSAWIREHHWNRRHKSHAKV